MDRSKQTTNTSAHSPNLSELEDDTGTNTERLVFFSDAVFAIAMTLLVIDIHVPEASTPLELWMKLVQLWPNFLSFTISFFVISTYWRVHHGLFRYIKRYDQTLITLNSLLLFLVALLPFTTALISEYGNWQLPVVIYDSSLVLASFIIAAIWRYATTDRKLVDANLDAEIVRYHTARSLYMSLAFVAVIALTFFVQGASAQLALLLIIPVRLIEHLVQQRRRKRGARSASVRRPR